MDDALKIILVAEDEPLTRMNAVECLQEMGFHVLQAGSASDAWAIALKLPTLLALFTDVEMPGSMDGVMLAHLTRLAFPEARIVVCSGRRLPMKQELPSGTRFLTKPYEFDALHFAINDPDGSLSEEDRRSCATILDTPVSGVVKQGRRNLGSFWMQRDAQIEKLLSEADNAKAWYAKLTAELKTDPGNESLLRLKDLCRLEFEKRWDMLFDLGVDTNCPNQAGKYPPIEE